MMKLIDKEQVLTLLNYSILVCYLKAYSSGTTAVSTPIVCRVNHAKESFGDPMTKWFEDHLWRIHPE